MKRLFVSRRRHEAILAELRIVHGIELDEARGQRDAAVEDAKRARADRDAFKDAADSANEKYTDTAIVNECLTEELARARAATPDDAGRPELEAEVADLKKRLARAQADVVSLSAELAEVRDNRRLVEGGSTRSRTDAAELRRLREQARLLDERVVELQLSHVADTRELHDLRQNGAGS